MPDFPPVSPVPALHATSGLLEGAQSAIGEAARFGTVAANLGRQDAPSASGVHFEQQFSIASQRASGLLTQAAAGFAGGPAGDAVRGGLVADAAALTTLSASPTHGSVAKLGEIADLVTAAQTLLGVAISHASTPPAPQGPTSRHW